MKALVNKITRVKKNETEFISYFDMFKMALENNSSRQGFSITEIRDRLTVLNALTGDKASLEDAPFNTLRDCWDAMKWNVINKDILDVDEYLKGIK